MLRQVEGLAIGDNQPYAGTDLAYTLNLHAGAAGLAHAAVEVRQDHCETPGQLDRWAEILGDALGGLLGMGNLHKIELF
jgi:predicted N-formylglutamate amidohydrolase